jgi:hypothetical protein
MILANRVFYKTRHGGGNMPEPQAQSQIEQSQEDGRHILEVLKFELAFLEQGGYGRLVRTPWKPTSTFQDSLSCLNFGDPHRSHPCSECLLTRFVPDPLRGEEVPCHHILLNAEGETVFSLERQASQQELEETVKEWLRGTIAAMEGIAGRFS